MLLVLALSSVLSQAAPAGPQPQGPAAKAAVPASLAKPAAQRLAAAQQAYQLTFGAFRQGAGHAEDVALWSRRLYEAQRDTDTGAAKAHLDRLVALEKAVIERHQAGAVSAVEVQVAAWARADAELLVGPQ